MIQRFFICLFATALMVSACGDANDSRAADQGFHPVESYTVVYKLEGTQTGTITEISRNHGGAVVQIRKVTTKVFGMTTTEDSRSITRAAQIINIDLKAQTATSTENPMYDLVAAAVEREGAEEAGKSFIRALGHKETDEHRTIAGESCIVWINAGFGQEICMTDDAIPLLVDTTMLGMNITQTATEIRRGDGGPDEMFEVPAGIEVTETPSLKDIQNMFRR